MVYIHKEILMLNILIKYLQKSNKIFLSSLDFIKKSIGTVYIDNKGYSFFIFFYVWIVCLNLTWSKVFEYRIISVLNYKTNIILLISINKELSVIGLIKKLLAPLINASSFKA